MKTRSIVAGVVIFSLFLFSCQTAATGANTDTNGAGRGVSEKMRTYLANAEQKMGEMAVAEAISQYVSVLALKDGLKQPAPDVSDLAAQAETALTKIEAGCLLQAGAAWLTADAVQVAASTYAAAQGDLVSPTVSVWYNIGGSRIAVSGMPVMFTIKSGSAQIAGTGLAKTNEYGEASVPPPKVNDANKEFVVQAAVVFAAGAYQYPFKQTKLDLVYRPPSKRAVILVFERDDQGQANDNPYVLDPVYNALKKMDFDFSQYNGRLLGDAFMKVYNGEREAIKGLTLDQSVPYLVLVLNDCYSVRRQGTFDIYVSEGRATLRLVRVADGKILFEAVGYADRGHGTHGQANSHDNAVRDALKRTTVELEKDLSLKMKEINRALGLD